ncbi:RNA polymerase sigma factor [Hugenholtzia roseola]|uniref:RNA polymerase sigma factor n=1 Tax=Hugenholtzia roseola TaxID=1002 RepID=UPI00047CF259|nr:sigma-70 family RNA polymerase sigma factor [Hugenholtzia roseola]
MESTKNLSCLLSENNLSYEKIYEQYFQMVVRYVQKNSGSYEDAQDLFQDTILVVLKKLKQDDFVLSASLKTYLMAIAKNLWLKRLREQKNRLRFIESNSLSLSEQENSLVQNWIDDERGYWERVQSYMQKVSNHCQNLLNAIFFHNKSIEEVQKEFNYSTRHNAQNQKYKCLEQVRKVKEKDYDEL